MTIAVVTDPNLVAVDDGMVSGGVRTAGTIQSCAVLLELSADWIILAASENAHAFFSEYPARLVGEPLARFCLAQPLHDLRNSLSRQRGSNGIARAYRVRLISEPRRFDFAFQSFGDRMTLEAVASPDEGVGEWLGAVNRVLDGLPRSIDQGSCLEAARRVRALSGFDQVTFYLEGRSGPIRADSSRGNFAPDPPADQSFAELPAIIADTRSRPAGMFPRSAPDRRIDALLASPPDDVLEGLRARGVGSMMNVPVRRDGKVIGGFSCESRSARQPLFELHAAIELFAQILALRLTD